jgi:undecaprenyl-diphosphatase
MDKLVAWDRALFLFLNEWHSPGMDIVMGYVIAKWFWLPAYAGLLIWLGIKLKRQVWGILISIALAITGADQLSSHVLKPLVGRLRPCHEPVLAGQVHTINGCGGLYGFVSSHAANTFALAFLFWLLFRQSSPWVSWLFLWALITGYSRIYDGAHYPADVVCGFAVGAFAAYLAAAVYRVLPLNAGMPVGKLYK